MHADFRKSGELQQAHSLIILSPRAPLFLIRRRASQNFSPHMFFCCTIWTALMECPPLSTAFLIMSCSPCMKSNPFSSRLLVLHRAGPCIDSRPQSCQLTPREQSRPFLWKPSTRHRRTKPHLQRSSTTGPLGSFQEPAASHAGERWERTRTQRWTRQWCQDQPGASRGILRKGGSGALRVGSNTGSGRPKGLDHVPGQPRLAPREPGGKAAVPLCLRVRRVPVMWSAE